MKPIFIFVQTLIIVNLTFAQSAFDSVLFSVEANNKNIQAAIQFYDSQAMLYKTGNTPNDPMVGFDYMKGSPVTAGNQLDFTVTQSFNFPTVYGNRKDLVNSQTSQSQYQVELLKQNILLETKLVCIELIYLNKMKSLIGARINHAETIYANYNNKLEKGDGNIIELNKAKINLFNLQNEIRLNNGKINGWIQKLTQLNGGIPINFSDTLYPMVSVIPSFDELEQLYEQQDPLLKSLEQQLVIAQQQVQLSKSLWLPTFETGYHYQSILGQTFNGVHLGMTIPLWEKNNTIVQKEMETGFHEIQIEQHKTEHYFELKQLYENYLALSTSYSEYKNLIETLASVETLEKALEGGQITVIEFFAEMSSYYATHNNMLAIEKEYQNVVAQLNKYLL